MEDFVTTNGGISTGKSSTFLCSSKTLSSLERAELAERNLKKIEDELQLVGENMKQLEMSAEKAVEREEKLKVTGTSLFKTLTIWTISLTVPIGAWTDRDTPTYLEII